MNAVKKDIRALTVKELIIANEHFPLFKSNHEAYAVILEEMEECQAEYLRMQQYLQQLWGCIKENQDDLHCFLTGKIKEAAIDLACEAVQVAAMCSKYLIFKATPCK